MKTTRLRCFAWLIVLGLVLMTQTACGKKGPVRPKSTVQALPPVELTLQQQGNLFVLGWTIPSTKLESGDQLDLTGFLVKRLTYDAADGCPTCREPETAVAEIVLRHPEPAQRIGKKIYWRDLDIRPGSGYSYAIVPLLLGGQQGPAARVHQAAVQPPPAPAGLQVTAGDQRVTLEWAAPGLPAQMQLLGYNLYRRQANRPFPIVPVNAEPLQETRLVDRGLDNGRAYEYRVSALVRVGDLQLESMASPGALITPQQGR